MNKISLKTLNLKEVEQLSRAQLKNVLGGWTDGTGGDVITTEGEGCSVKITCRDGAEISCSGKKCDYKAYPISNWSGNGYVECDGSKTSCK
jgi:hypothetical protein